MSSQYNLNGLVFSPVQNSEHGTVAATTVFKFKQLGKQISAIYSGGDVVDGHIIGQFISNDKAALLYHNVTKSGDLQAGEAEAIFAMLPDKRLTIHMNWQWLNGDKSNGISYYEEIKNDTQS